MTAQRSFCQLLILLLVAGCATAPRAPATMNEALYASARYATVVAKQVNEAYLAQLINKDQQMKALDSVEEAMDAAKAARTAYDAGNFDEAQSKLDVADGILRAVQTLTLELIE